MQFSLSDLAEAERSGVIERSVHDQLVAFLKGRRGEAPAVATAAAASPARFDFSHLLWYAGALIVIGSMGLFSTLAFSQMGGSALVATALAYAAMFVFAGHRLWHSEGLKTPGGLLIACAVAMAPLAVFGFQEWWGLWLGDVKPGSMRDFYIWIKGGWVPMEIATILAALVALSFYRFPFILAVAAVAIWFLTMDFAEFWVMATRSESSRSYTSLFQLRAQISMWMGLGVMLIAWIVDLKPREADFAFWLHLAGVAAFWGGMSVQSSNSEIAKFVYFLINVGLLLFSIYLLRRSYAVFGAMGIVGYLGYLASSVFRNSLMFPFALSLIGLAIIGLGILYFRNRTKIEVWLNDRLPDALRLARPAHARHTG
jgi:hypothetical protein